MVEGIKELLSLLMYTDDEDDDPKKLTALELPLVQLTALEQFKSEVDLTMPTLDLIRVHDSIIAVMGKPRDNLRMYEHVNINDADEVMGYFRDTAFEIAKELLSREVSKAIRMESRTQLENNK